MTATPAHPNSKLRVVLLSKENVASNERDLAVVAA